MRDRPFIFVSVNGQPVSDAFYQRLVRASIVDSPGQDADTAEFLFDDEKNLVEMPKEGASISVKFGYRGMGGARMGLFTVEQAGLEGGDGGEFISLTARSADMRSDLKEAYSEHFENETVGGIAQKLAARHGLQAVVSAGIASEKIDYVARVEQSTSDFLTRLGERFGGFYSLKGGKLLLIQRGTGFLPALTIDKSECESWSMETNPRPRHGKVAAKSFNRKTAEIEMVEDHTGMDGPTRRLRFTHNSKEEAKKAVVAEGEKLSRATASGSLTLAGRPEAVAEQDLILTGFRKEMAGKWRNETVTHEFDGAYMTTIDFEAPEGGRG